MQLYAFDNDFEVVAAAHAEKQKNYLCLECRGTVRIRKGQHRHVHFYHLTHSDACRLSGKSLIHLQTQIFLHSLLPAGESHLEFRIPEINRIADLAWIPQKIIFEIQCSPITAQEVHERIQDYASQGFQVVWILHDKRYNQWRMTAAEQYLQDKLFYFTNIDAYGRGMIYDQFDLIKKGIRKQTLPFLQVKLNEPKLFCSKKCQIPPLLSRRMPDAHQYFAGDLIDRCNENPEWAQMYFAKIHEAEDKKPLDFAKNPFKRFAFKWIFRPYRLFLQILLERACK